MADARERGGYTPTAEFLTKIDTFVAEHREPYSIADAMRIVGRAKSARPPAHLRPRIREILVEDGVTTLFHPQISEGTLRKICVAIGPPDPQMSQRRRQYWQEKGIEAKPQLTENERETLRARRGKINESPELLPEDRERIEVAIDTALQGREIPSELVERVRRFFDTNLRDFYLLMDLFDAVGMPRMKSGASVRRVVEMAEVAGIRRGWKTAPLLLPLSLAVAGAFEIGFVQQDTKVLKPAEVLRLRKQQEPAKALSYDEAQQLAAGDQQLETWLGGHLKVRYGLTDVAYALGYRGGGASQRVVVLAREVVAGRKIDVSKQHVFLSPELFVDVYREVKQKLSQKAERSPQVIFAREPKKRGRPRISEEEKERRKNEREKQRERPFAPIVAEPLQEEIVFPDALIPRVIKEPDQLPERIKRERRPRKERVIIVHNADEHLEAPIISLPLEAIVFETEDVKRDESSETAGVSAAEEPIQVFPEIVADQQATSNVTEQLLQEEAAPIVVDEIMPEIKTVIVDQEARANAIASVHPLENLTEEIPEVDKRLIMQDVHAAELGGILQMAANWRDLERVIQRYNGNIGSVGLSEIQRQYRAVLRGRTHLPNNRAMRYLMEVVLPGFAGGNRQAIITAQESESAKVFLRVLADIPERELWRLMDEYRFRFVTSR